MLERRQFISALASSVVTAGCPLPAGFPDPNLPILPLPVMQVREWTEMIVLMEHAREVARHVTGVAAVS